MSYCYLSVGIKRAVELAHAHYGVVRSARRQANGRKPAHEESLSASNLLVIQ